MSNSFLFAKLMWELELRVTRKVRTNMFMWELEHCLSVKLSMERSNSSHRLKESVYLYWSWSIEKPKKFSTSVFSSGLLMVHNAAGRSDDKVSANKNNDDDDENSLWRWSWINATCGGSTCNLLWSTKHMVIFKHLLIWMLNHKTKWIDSVIKTKFNQSSTYPNCLDGKRLLAHCSMSWTFKS